MWFYIVIVFFTNIFLFLQRVRIYAGVHRSRNGVISPIGTGRLCNWTPDIDGPAADEYPSFGAYQRSLTLKCDEGEPGVITWRPDENTPDTVYYQCFTHRHLGWKINVLDSCDQAQASQIDEVFAEPDSEEDTLVPESSIIHETKIRPNEIFLLQHEKDLIKNHNMNEQPPKVQFDLSKNSEITKIIADGIKAAEALEESIANPKGNKTYEKPIITDSQSKSQQPPGHSINAAPYSGQPLPPTQHTKTQLHDEASPLSEYLRPPVVPHGPMFRPVKIAGRRPSTGTVERRRPLNTQNQYRLVLPQPSIIVNHYKKPVSPLIRPFVKQQKPIKSIASFLLLGQPTELGPSRKTFDQKPSKSPESGSTKGPFKSSPHRENYPPKSKISKIPDQIQGQHSQQIGVRKKPQREPINSPVPTFKAPYEVIDHSQPIPIHNTGFQPDSVIVEGGFKPIVRRRIEDEEDAVENSNRRSDDVSDIDEAIEGDALFINHDIPTKAFEPMFIPSPPDSINVSSKKLLQKEHLTGDLQDMEIEEGDDKMAMAGERVDAYYLPPDTHKSPPHNVYPEGSVVTYDGKAVLDTSLVNLPPPLPPHYNSQNSIIYPSSHLSKTEQLIRYTPQFGPFTGEIPPLLPGFVPPDFAPPIVYSSSNSSNSNNKTQVPVTEYTNPQTSNTNPISTKLTLLPSSAAKIIRTETETKDNDDDDADTEDVEIKT